MLDATPVFSVVIPVYEQWNLVPYLLQCLADQTFSQSSFEVLLVDNGSVNLVTPRELPKNVAIFRHTTPGSYAARNYGVGLSKGEWIAFTDADCRPKPNWLSALFGEIERNATLSPLLAGPVNVFGGSAAPNAYEIYDMVRGIPQRRYVARGYAATANLCVKRSDFVEIGGFDPQRYSGGDAEFCRRAGAMGKEIIYLPDAAVQHPARTTWNEISTKARRVKGGQIRAGTTVQRMKWLAATSIAPFRQGAQIIVAVDQPIRFRLVALVVMIRLWIVELLETGRLLLGKGPERR